MSKANSEVANLTERKNTHTHVYGVKEFVILSLGSRIIYMLHNCYKLITLLIVILYRIPRMSDASHVEGLIPV